MYKEADFKKIFADFSGQAGRGGWSLKRLTSLPSSVLGRCEGRGQEDVSAKGMTRAHSRQLLLT